MKPKLIFIEGCQACGKSTICKELREKLKYTTLMDLSAIEDKTESGERAMYKYHSSILDMFDNTKYCGMSYVVCRSFMSEKIYCNLGYKPYTFEQYYRVLVKELEYLTRYYSVYFILLTTNQYDLSIRLKRDKAEYHKFSVENSLAQQEEYQKEFRKLARITDDDLHILEMENDNIERVVNTIIKVVSEGLIG